jgi:hypothetical protein
MGSRKLQRRVLSLHKDLNERKLQRKRSGNASKYKVENENGHL